MKRFVLAPDSFKGTMSAAELCDIWEQAIQARIPGADCRRFPLADGGEGMVDALLSMCGGRKVTARVSGPFGRPVEAEYGILPGGRAVIEMAACAGLPLVGERKDPERATTYGVGELIRHAVKNGAKEVVLGLGGSATNDCGIGMAAALGYRFLDADGRPLEPLALHMERVARIERPGAPLNLRVTAACDVDNPLCGPTGATFTFGMQKGAQGQVADLLERGMKNMAGILRRDLGADVLTLPGAGAAGGLGAGTVAFLGGKLVPGIELMLDAARFDEALAGADMVFTGEGRIDWQSARGKVPVGVSRRCRKAGVPCVALCGSIGKGAEAVYGEGITAVFSATPGICTFADVKRTCREDMARLTDAVLRLLLING